MYTVAPCNTIWLSPPSLSSFLTYQQHEHSHSFFWTLFTWLRGVLSFSVLLLWTLASWSVCWSLLISSTSKHKITAEFTLLVYLYSSINTHYSSTQMWCLDFKYIQVLMNPHVDFSSFALKSRFAFLWPVYLIACSTSSRWCWQAVHP